MNSTFYHRSFNEFLGELADSENLLSNCLLSFLNDRRDEDTRLNTLDLNLFFVIELFQSDYIFYLRLQAGIISSFIRKLTISSTPVLVLALALVVLPSLIRSK